MLGMQWWSHDTTKMGDITRSDTARHRVLAATIQPDENKFTPGMHNPTVMHGQTGQGQLNYLP